MSSLLQGSPPTEPRGPFAERVREKLVHQGVIPHPYKAHPTGWVRDRLGGFLWSRQEQIAESVRDHRHTAVRSAHGTGKSYIASRLAAWWLDVHPVGSAFVATTAPTQPQVDAILWREIRSCHRKGKLEGRITLDAHWYMGDDELVAFGRKPADYSDVDKARQAFQGIHARYILIIMDEACGIPTWLWEAVDSLATNEDARVLAIGNPDDPATEFESVCRPGSGWNQIHISAFDLPTFTGEEVPEELDWLLTGRTWVEERKKRWGESSPLYISKVLGEFPEVTEDTLVTPSMWRSAVERELPGLDTGRYGVDVARTGGDESAIYRWRGGVIRKKWVGHDRDTMSLTGRVAQLIAPHNGKIPAIIDVIGIGAGVFDRLREQGLNVTAFNSSERADDPVRFANRRAEAFWTLRELFEDGAVDVDGADEDLAAQLTSIKYGIDSSGRLKIEAKEKMKKRGLPSPDRADAAAMSSVGTPSWALGATPPTGAQGLTNDLLERKM